MENEKDVNIEEKGRKDCYAYPRKGEVDCYCLNALYCAGNSKYSCSFYSNKTSREKLEQEIIKYGRK